MAKIRFKRSNVHDKKMKKIIMRLDYAGILEVKDLIKVFDNRFPKSFKNRKLILNKEVNVTLRKKDLEEIGKTLALPANIIEKSTVTRYTELNKEVACNVTLDISQYYICMVIECNEDYDGLDKYTEVFKGATKTFKDKVPYFQPKRFGLRKFREENDQSIERVRKPFENYVFPIKHYPNANCNLLKSEYTDCIIFNDMDSLKFNIHSLLKESTDENKRKIFVSVLDLDAYYDNEEILSGDLNKLIDRANEQEFEIYKYCMTEEYLASISDE